MKYIKPNDDILHAFSEILNKKEEVIIKQAAENFMPLTEQEDAALQEFLFAPQVGLVDAPNQGPGMDKWIKKLKGTSDVYLASVLDALTKRYELWLNGVDAKELSKIPVPKKVTASSEKTSNIKLAKSEFYPAMPDSKMVETAHPKTAIVSGDVVENLNEQQAAMLKVVNKKAEFVLNELQKLASQLYKENDKKSFKLVYETYDKIKKQAAKPEDFSDLTSLFDKPLEFEPVTDETDVVMKPTSLELPGELPEPEFKPIEKFDKEKRLNLIRELVETRKKLKALEQEEEMATAQEELLELKEKEQKAKELAKLHEEIAKDVALGDKE